MRELAEKEGKGLLQGHTEMMTTRELAETLGVDVSTVVKTVKRLNETSEVLPKFRQGQTPRFTEEQATLIKQEIQRHHNLASRQIDNVAAEEKSLSVIDEQEVLGKHFVVYGTAENPLFLAKDVAEWIEYAKTGNGDYDVSSMLKSVDEDEKVQMNTTNIFRSKGNPNKWFLTENGLYEVLMLSSKPIAKEFKRQVKDILRTIRRNGIYATDKVIDRILDNPDYGIALLTKLKEERAARVEAEKTNAVLMHVSKTYTATEIAKELGLRSAIELNKRLEEKKVQFFCNGTWIPRADYADCGYFEIKQEVLDSGKVIYHRRITQIGRKFILGLF